MTQDLRKNPKPPRWSAESARQIAARVVVEAELVLKTPAHFGSGDSPEDTVIPLLVDPYDEVSPLLPGASIAGALRAYLLARQGGYLSSDEFHRNSHAARLFGSIHSDTHHPEQMLLQSRVIVNDAIGQWRHDGSPHDVRRGVKLDRHMHTAEDKLLFTHELWNAGTVFPLHCELLIYDTDHQSRAELIGQFAVALSGLSDGSIRIGARKQRGFGEICVETWHVREFNLRQQKDLLAWLRLGNDHLSTVQGTQSGTDLIKLFSAVPDYPDARQIAALTASFAIDGSLLIREYEEDSAVHLSTLHQGQMKPIVSGTSVAGALRSRMHKIAATIHAEEDAHQHVASLFGTEVDPQNARNTRASRIQIDETIIEGTPADWVQARVSIDRFTGGALDGALFTEKPIFGVNDVKVTLNIRIINPRSSEIGWLLLALKDLWTGDLPIGGERSIGRGRLQGIEATLTTSEGTWTIIEGDDKNSLRIVGEVETLEAYAATFVSGGSS